MKYLFTFSLFILFIACETDEPIQIPQCINDEIPVFAPFACPGSGDLTIWSFNGEDVFCFNEGSCIADASAYIYDADCNLVCVLGGINGNEICDGLDWSSNASYLELVYVY